MNATYYVTTSIPYVNARPHVGFALELVQADALARWHRLLGEEVFFLTGADENALKNVQAAAREGLTPRELCDRNAAVFQDLLRALDISADRFIRTSGEAHFRGASKFWGACRKGDIYRRRYRGLYCVGCEDFYIEKDLEEGRCPTHLTRPEIVEEENYFFRLSAYQERLEELILSERLRIAPETRRNEALGFIRQGLQDFSISRVRERSGGWGIPVPGDPSQVIYVWFDALTNYLTGLGYGSDEGLFERFWLTNPRKAHVIGKDVLKFHAVYWPAMLLSAGLPLPETVWAHGFLTVDGQKISKSLSNAVDPFYLVERYGRDAVRYYLLRAIPSGADGDFSEARLREVYSADLANGLGNLVRRVETLCERAGYRKEKSERERRRVGEWEKNLSPFPPFSLSPFSHSGRGWEEGFRFHDALRAIWGQVRVLNQEIEEARPWDLLKQGSGTRLDDLLTRWVAGVRSIAWGLTPFLPETAQEIEEAFSGERIAPREPLFPRLNPVLP
ncbi:MAG: hypothetical protein A3F84_26680 [Candidatus Handelsmanbacteria bacterium RIFCSPLOWO2_12_FULL_64_10]|uniref:methionine--tRNA ligase n=1 Tax=Handelsmanbacteria sp. (strain RIFCSPLOWO2_12_FULL_64_10) TaxID=1817868 RepID=A0A1F6CQQ2_HANXR|nr:MAG: hypothetical protein A3F84_26680 [Candidatus Handelsmanbacteria bacterium RIFCSPLOWO2_12_FULL_64_10]